MRVAVAVVISLFFGFGPAPADDAPRPVRSVEGQIEWADLPSARLKLKSGEVFEIEIGARNRLKELREVGLGLALDGSWVRLFLDSRRRVVEVEPIAPPEGATERAARTPKYGEWEALARSLKPGDLVNVDDVTYGFNFYQNGVLSLDVLGSKGRGSVPKSLNDIRKFERVAGGPDGTGSEGPPRTAFLPRIGDTVMVDGVKAFVIDVDPTRLVLQTREGEKREILRALVKEIYPITQEEWMAGAPAGSKPAAATEPPQKTSAAAPRIDFDTGTLDAAANTWTVRGTVRHARAGFLLVGARVEIEADGEGRLLSPSEELEVVRGKGAELPKEGIFDWLGVKHDLRRAGEEIVIAQIGIESERKVVVLDSVFPGVPEPFQWACAVYNPKFRAKLVDEAVRFCPCTDAEAYGPILRAFERGDSAHRQAALDAIAASRNPAFLPYLFWQIYRETDSPEPIEKAFLSFGAAGEDWLVKFLEKAAASEGAAGISFRGPGGEEVRKEARDEDRLKARGLELLLALKSDRAYAVALKNARSEDKDLRAAARACFFDEGRAPVSFLLRNLLSSPDAQALLAELDERRPGTLAEIYSERLKISDPDFERSIGGETPERVRAAYLQRIRKELATGVATLVDPEVQIARDKARDLEALGREIARLREEVSRAYVAAAIASAPEGADERHWRAEAYRRAIAFDPANALARRGLAGVLFDAAREMQQGVNLRGGPGPDFRVLRTLERGERLAPAGEATAPEGALWLHVRVHSVTGYVPRDSVRETPDGFEVTRSTRPLAVIAQTLLDARALDWEAAGRIDEALAEVRAEEAAEAALAGDWERAYALYREAASRKGGGYRLRAAVAFVRANPIVLAGALFAAVAFTVSFLFPKRLPEKKRARPPEGPRRVVEPEPGPEGSPADTQAKPPERKAVPS